MNCKIKFEYTAGGRLVATDGLSSPEVELTVADDGERRVVTAEAKTDIVLSSYREYDHDFFITGSLYEPDPKGDLYFINGYQSWTETREFYGDARERNVMALPKFLVKTFAFDRYGDAMFYEYDKRVLHGYDVFYVKGQSNAFVASLNSKNAYLIFEVVRKTGSVDFISDVGGVSLAAGEKFVVADYIYAGCYDEGIKLFDKYFPKREIGKIFGYTSWYNYYQNINEEIIMRDLDALDDRFDLFQIDDGYETFVGDWLDVDPKKFPNGLKPVVDKIHSRGFMAGVWLAPFVAEEESKLFKERKNLFKKFPNGEYVKCGSNWSGFYALDLGNPDAREYIRKSLDYFVGLGFDFFKLDFLYAANLAETEGKTRSAAAEEAYSFLREALGDKLILGCGATTFNAAGKFDYLRVGPDVSLEFDDAWYMRRLHRERISTKVTLQNTVFRSFTDGRLYGNDPDVFLLRDDNIKLTEKQRYALATINALFGSVLMTSDNIATYDEEKRKTLSYAIDLFRNARVTGYSRRGDEITIEYNDGEKDRKIVYNTVKGEIL